MIASIHEAALAVASQWQEAWNSHDMARMAILLCDDVDWITVAGKYMKGRAATEAAHAVLHAGTLGRTRWTNHKVEVTALASNMALVHLWWRLEGEQDPDGNARAPRDGVFTWLLAEDGRWRIRAAQATTVVS